MSLHEYRESQRVAGEGYPFYALIMAAMRQADTDNVERLKQAFPETWRELKARYRASYGRLDSDDA